MKFKIGIDLGSTTSKCIMLKDHNIYAATICPTGTNPELAAKNVLKQAQLAAQINKQPISITVTGYGRRQFPKANKIITEISAAALGGFYLAGQKEILVLDIGGQDTKVIDVNKKGEIEDFLMNDKCAAGTGRFLDIMAQVLQEKIGNLSKLAFKSRQPIEINSTCSVFAESEIISLIANKTSKYDLAAGIYLSIAKKIEKMLINFKLSKPVLFCGGGARHPYLAYCLNKNLKNKLKTVEIPQYVSALGAALSA